MCANTCVTREMHCLIAKTWWELPRESERAPAVTLPEETRIFGVAFCPPYKLLHLPAAL